MEEKKNKDIKERIIPHVEQFFNSYLAAILYFSLPEGYSAYSNDTSTNNLENNRKKTTTSTVNR